MRVAIVHDWLNGMRGGERVLEALLDQFPQAALYTLLHTPGRVSPAIEACPIRTSFIQRLPMAHRHYRRYLPLFPMAVERFDLSGFDLVLSTSHCVALGALTHAATCHIGYCFTPMRYAWDMTAEYLASSQLGPAGRLVFPPLLTWLRTWDRSAAQRPDFLACISHHVARRVAKHYGRTARVIYPPVETDFYVPDGRSAEDWYLVVSSFAPYKRVDLAIEAFSQMGKRLVVIGTGQEDRRLRAIAGPSITFLGWQPDTVLREHYSRCRALIFPGEEDFGIVPLEAMACGRPVIAFGKGGATETGIDGVTGLFFHEQTPETLRAAVTRFERMMFDPATIRAHAERFARPRFLDEMAAFVEECLDIHRRNQKGESLPC